MVLVGMGMAGGGDIAFLFFDEIRQRRATLPYSQPSSSRMEIRLLNRRLLIRSDARIRPSPSQITALS